MPTIDRAATSTRLILTPVDRARPSFGGAPARPLDRFLSVGRIRKPSLQPTSLTRTSVTQHSPFQPIPSQPHTGMARPRPAAPSTTTGGGRLVMAGRLLLLVCLALLQIQDSMGFVPAPVVGLRRVGLGLSRGSSSAYVVVCCCCVGWSIDRRGVGPDDRWIDGPIGLTTHAPPPPHHTQRPTHTQITAWRPPPRRHPPVRSCWRRWAPPRCSARRTGRRYVCGCVWVCVWLVGFVGGGACMLGDARGAMCVNAAQWRVEP